MIAMTDISLYFKEADYARGYFAQK